MLNVECYIECFDNRGVAVQLHHDLLYSRLFSFSARGDRDPMSECSLTPSHTLAMLSRGSFLA